MPEEIGPGVYLLGSVTKERVELQHAVRIERASRRLLHPPIVRAADGFETSVSEIVLWIIGRDGTVIESFAWPAQTEIFVDRLDPETHEFSCSTVRQAEWDARWWIPLDEPARFLQFSRTDVRVDRQQGRSLTRTNLGVFDLAPGEPGAPSPPWPVPTPDPPEPIPLPPLTLPRRMWRELGWTRAKMHRNELVAPAGGHIKDHYTIIDNGDPAERFDIVIVGDGFQEAELSTFDYYAALVADSLTQTAPFLNLSDRINVYAVRAVSVDSGISRCPNQTPIKNTYFKTTGFWNGRNNAGYIGTHAKAKILYAVETVIPQQYAILIVVIVNCLNEGGGSAPADLGMVFLTLSNDDETFKNVAAHESAHVIAKVGEEYNPCNPPDGVTQYPNQATTTQVNTNTVPWLGLATPSELDVNGHFKVIHRYGDGDVDLEDPRVGDGIAECQPDLPANRYGMLGAFWGCHSGTADPSHPWTGDYCDSRGAAFYRPMAECKMRRRVYDFCRVCSRLITDVILDHSV